MGLERHYLIQGNDDCDGMEPLIKKVVAVPGDHVVLTDAYVEVNGKQYAYPTLHHDSLNRELSTYPRGDYRPQRIIGFWACPILNPGILVIGGLFLPDSLSID